MAFCATIICVLISIVGLVVYFVKHKYSLWKRLGIPHEKPSFPLGNVQGLNKTRHFRDIMLDYYNKYKGAGPFVGMFFFLNPAALILDLDLARDILIKDFQNFTDRGLYSNERDDPLSGHIFNLDGEKWKSMRNKLSPTFTSGKMKYMFSTIVSVGDELSHVFSKLVETDPVVEMKDVLARYSTDVIGTCAFGIDCNSLKDPNVEFHVVASNVFSKPRHNKLIEGFMIGFPDLARKLGMKIIHEDIHQFFMRVVKETVEYREKNSVKRNDFMDLMIEMKNSEVGLTVEQIAAQAFIFFIAGSETTSTTMGLMLFELALNQDVQDKLRAEVNARFEENNGKLTYEAITKMPYMEKVMKETLRKYSINLTLMRKCRNDYTTSNPNFVIPKGMIVFIQAHAIQNDPEYFPNPDKFDPERFSPEEVQKRHPMTWLPFGDGPRNCIGLRFAKMQTIIGLSSLLRNYKFHYCEKTPNPIEIDLKNPLVTSKGGIYLKVEKIKC